MERLIALLLAGLLVQSLALAQGRNQQLVRDSLEGLLPSMPADTNKVKRLYLLSKEYGYHSPIKSAQFAEQGLALAKQLRFRKGIVEGYLELGFSLDGLGRTRQAADAFYKALRLSEANGFHIGQAHAYLGLGNLSVSQNDHPKAIEYYEKAAAIYEANLTPKLVRTLNNTYVNLGTAYGAAGQSNKKLGIYQKALKLAQDHGKPKDVVIPMVNLANLYRDRQDFEKAIAYAVQAEQVARAGNYVYGAGASTEKLGMIYRDLKHYDKAVTQFSQAVKTFGESGYDTYRARNLTYLGGVYLQWVQDSVRVAAEERTQPGFRKAALDKAIVSLEASVQLNQKIGEVGGTAEALEMLAEAQDRAGNPKAALKAHRQYLVFRDSLTNTAKAGLLTQRDMSYRFGKREDSMRFQQQLTRQQLEKQTLLARQQGLLAKQREQDLLLGNQQLTLSEKEKALQSLAYQKTQAELLAEQSQGKERERQLEVADRERKLQQAQLEAERQKRYYYLGGLLALGGFLALAVYSYRRQRISNRLLSLEQKRLSEEKQKSESLLLNILPEEVAQELKETGRSKARHYQSVTVLFTDFVNFTQMAEQVQPQELVDELHACFKAFDEIIERHGLEKIKTIGDAYLAVSGLPEPKEDHAQRAVQAALEIREWVQNRVGQKGIRPFQVRIGLHSGPVVAGIVGVKKFAYDIWGDTVNTAARMEQHGEPGKVNISAATYAMVKDGFACAYRGEIAAKNKGEMAMYFVERAGVLAESEKAKA